MAWPTFIIIGAAKSATTTIHALLDQHPEIHMSWPKEPGYWAFEADTPFRHHLVTPLDTMVTDSGDYQALFEPGRDAQARGESSTQYMTTPGLAKVLRERLPDVRLVAVLRHPVERAYSAYMHLVREGQETERDFSQALELEEERRHQGFGNLWHYVHSGFYARLLRDYYEIFPPEQILVCLYDEFTNEPVKTLQKIFQHVGASANFQPELKEKRNVGGHPRSRMVMRLVKNPGIWKEGLKPILPRVWRRRMKETLLSVLMKKEALSPSCASRLSLIYREDMMELETLIGKDLGMWIHRYGG